MPTAYECLHKAVIKNFGKWYRFEWNSTSPKIRDKIKHHALAEEYWQNIFLRLLSNLQFSSSSDGSVLITGSLIGTPHQKDGQTENIHKLTAMTLTDRFWVYSSYDFDDRFSLCSFKTKEDAIKQLKVKQDDLFFIFWFRI